MTTTTLTNETLVALKTRNENGEKAGELAAEVGVTVQKLVAAWKKMEAGSTVDAASTEGANEETTMDETVTEPVAVETDDEKAERELLEEEAARVAAEAQAQADIARELESQDVRDSQPVAVEITGPAEEPAPKAKKEEPACEYSDEVLEAAAKAKREGAGWGEVAKLLPGVGSWNRAHSLVTKRFPDLKGSK